MKRRRLSAGSGRLERRRQNQDHHCRGESGYTFDLGKDSPDQFDVDLYEMDSLHDLAVQFVDEGLYTESSPHPSRIIWIMTPSPAISAWITAKSRLTAPAIFTACN